MPEFSVTPQHIMQSTRPMHGISGALADAHGQIGAHAAAADGTNGADTVRAVFGAWSAALPQYAQAADRMIASMMLSATGYLRTDEAISGQADGAAP
jgi:hypothetical protein